MTTFSPIETWLLIIGIIAVIVLFRYLPEIRTYLKRTHKPEHQFKTLFNHMAVWTKEKGNQSTPTQKLQDISMNID